MKVPTKGVMLACNEEVDLYKIAYPKLASYKIDGIYCLIYDGVLFSRDLKTIPNTQVTRALDSILKASKENNLVFCGELYDPTIGFSELSGLVRSLNRYIPATFSFWCFDCVDIKEWDRGTGDVPFVNRYARLRTFQPLTRFDPVWQHNVMDAEATRKLFVHALEKGYEGLILRDPHAYYKHGRCTYNDQDLLKLKDMATDEGVIIEVLEKRKMVEGVERSRNSRGLLEKVHEKDNFVPGNTLGAFRVRLRDGRVCKVGTGKGQNDRERRRLWDNRESLTGRVIEFRYLRTGEKNLPRMAKFVRFREDLDASTQTQ